MANFNSSLQRCICAALLFAGALLPVFAVSPAWAAELSGVLRDAATGTPIAGATVRVLGSSEQVETAQDGHYAFDLPHGKYELAIEATVGGEVYRSRVVNQYVPQFRVEQAHVYTDWFLKQGIEPQEHAPGLPSFSGEAPSGGPDSFDLRDLFTPPVTPTGYTLPSTPPTTIRVGRRRESTGSGGCTEATNPVVSIEEMDLDEYVKGVLPPEIGVFRNIPGVSEVYKAFAIAAKSYGLYFVLRYGEGNRRSVGRALPPHGYTWFHIDDTACNQRYTNDRLTITTNAANAVAHKILVNKSNPNAIDKYEYAASCGKHGTRPQHQTALVPDKPPVSSCAGSWCGHNACAGHEVNPNAGGSARCLVRGICQWGAASWGEAGKNYLWLLDHYQPNLQLREIGQSGPASVPLAGYAHTNPADISGSGVAGVTITLSDGQTATTNAQGRYDFAQVRLDLRTIDITATKAGYHTATRSKDLEAGVTNWGSIQVIKMDDVPTGPEPTADAGSPGDGTPDAGVQTPDAGAPTHDDAGLSDATQPDVAPADTGHADSLDDRADARGDTPLERPVSQLGPILQESTGVRAGGCGCSASQGGSPGIPGGLALFLAGVGVLWARRRPPHPG